jgi:cytochrome oxidase assembly protein ShyY1
VYRFLLTARWLGLASLAVVLATIMVGLGNWQLDRYHEKSAMNDRIDAAAAAAPVLVTEVLRVGGAPTPELRYTRVSATGRYDPGHEILVRGRTVDGKVGFEVLTPFVLADGTALLVDRGWVAPPRGGDAAAEPVVPPAPAGEQTITGAVRLQERATGRVERRGERLEVRRINSGQLAGALPYKVLGGYVTVEQHGLVPIAVEYEGTLQNGGYALQWWAFAALTVVGYGYLARRHARGEPAADADAGGPTSAAGPNSAAEPTRTPTPAG